MIYKHIYDVEHVERIIDLFLEAVSMQPEQHGKPVSFANGYMNYEEGYKLLAFVKAADILDAKHWKKSMIRSGEIAERAVKAMYIRENNFVFKSQKISFRKAATAAPAKVGQAIYDLFTETDDANNLEKLVACVGRRYDTISYLFFLKDPDSYFPCKPRKFGKAFSLLGMDSACLKSCTYENYCSFNEALKELATLYSVYADHISALDAHSFAWTISQNKDIYGYIFSEKPEEDSTEKREVVSQAKIRLNQSKFRDNVISCWDGRCAVTGCDLTDILEAAHIKSWKECKLNRECISPYNGLLLIPNLHKLFDKGYISFSSDGMILISDRILEADRKKLGIDESMTLRIVDPNREKYLRYHRDNVFK